MPRYCFCCDLKNDPNLIAEYRKYHEPGNIWPEIIKSIKDSGVADMQIYLSGNRLFMIMEADKNFNIHDKAQMDERNPKVQEWENLMWNYQKALPEARAGEKWMAMEKIFELSDC